MEELLVYLCWILRQILKESNGMLVLTRKIGDSLVIDHNTIVRVTDIKGRNVKLSIEAPPSISVNRLEVEVRGRYKDDLNGDRPS